MANKRSYDDYVHFFKVHKCKVLNTKEEYDMYINNCKYKKFKLEYTCGHHIDNVYFHTFLYRKSNSTCLLCKDTKRLNNNCFNIELVSLSFLKNLLKNDFIIIQCVESCKTDLIVKPKYCHKDEWLALQIKATTKAIHNQYKFNIDKKYTYQSLLCICNEEERIWGFKTIPDTKRINIGISKKNKYNDYEITKDNLVSILYTFYESSTKFTEMEINIPGCASCVIEQEYINKRETCINSLTFIKPEGNNLVYDFTLYGKKIQEKTVNTTNIKGNIFKFKLQKNNGSVKGIRKYINYHIKDNDFYWLNLRNTDIFYIIPSHILYKHGYLYIDGDVDKKGTLIIDIHYTDGWYNNYRFNYKSVDILGIHNIVNSIYI